MKRDILKKSTAIFVAPRTSDYDSSKIAAPTTTMHDPLAARMENALRVHLHCHPRRDLPLRYAEGSAAPTAQPGKSNDLSELRIG